MKRILVLLVSAIIVGGIGYYGYTVYAANNKPAPPAPPIIQVKASSAVASAKGAVVPVRHTTLAFKTGGRVVEVLAREGDTVKAGAVLARVDDTTVKAQVAQAEAALLVAQRQLAQLSAGATAPERQAAQDSLASARATYAKIKAGPTVEQLAQLKANLDNAQATVSQAQFRYDRIGGDTNPFGAGAPERLALQQATNNFLAAQGAYREALSHPTDSELKAAQSAITQAEGSAARLDPTPEQIALAQAQVAQAQAALDLARTALQDAVLTSPFDGTITDTQIELGQFVSPGAPAYTFADLSTLQVETVDLAEVDVAKVSSGQNVSIKFDAFPEEPFTGQVVRIAQTSTDYRGDKVYKVTIALPQGNGAGLRWGMTANVDIGADK